MFNFKHIILYKDCHSKIHDFSVHKYSEKVNQSTLLIF